MVSEPIAGRPAQGFGKLQIVMRELYALVPQVARQAWEHRLRVLASAVTAPQGFHRKTVAQIMEPRGAAPLVQYLGGTADALPSGPKRHRGQCRRPAIAARPAVPNQRCV